MKFERAEFVFSQGDDTVFVEKKPKWGPAEHRPCVTHAKSLASSALKKPGVK